MREFARHDGCKARRAMGKIGDYAIDRALPSLTDEACFEGVHTVLPRRAHLQVATTNVAAGRVMREACVLETLRHPGVPRIFDCGVVADNLPWVARELVAGQRFTAPLAARELAAVLRDVGAILAYAHARGVVHGDVWLDAIVKNDGSRDFPVCLVNWHRARRDAPADERAGDVYALGVLAYAALPAQSPARLAELVDSMLAPTREARPTAAEVSADAARFLELAPEDDTEVEEVALVVDLSRQPPPPPGARTPRSTPSAPWSASDKGVPLAQLKLR